MTGVLLAIQIVISLLITIAVLLQKSSNIGLGVYSGSNESLFGARGPAGFMAKLTMFLGLIFVINTIALGYFYAKEINKSVIDSTKLQSVVPKAHENDKNSLNTSKGLNIPSSTALDKQK